MKEIIKSILRNVLFWQARKNAVYVFIDKNQLATYPEYLERSEFYLGNSFKIILYKNSLDFFMSLLLYGPYRVLFSTSHVPKIFLNLYFLNVDYLSFPMDGWSWYEALSKLNPISEQEVKNSKNRFVNYCKALPSYEFSLVMETGPSLAKSKKLVGLESYKIVCNTIVKDLPLWTQLKPHFIVAGDAIYHFGHNQYATSFRRDLKKCLETHEGLFLYPSLYHSFVKKEFKAFSHLLILSL